MANKLALEIEKILSAEVGEFIARSTVKKNCELIGATADSITSDMLPQLADMIDKSVVFFTGKESGGDLVTRIKSISV